MESLQILWNTIVIRPNDHGAVPFISTHGTNVNLIFNTKESPSLSSARVVLSLD